MRGNYAYTPKVDADDAYMCWASIGGPDADLYDTAYTVLRKTSAMLT